MIQATIVGAGKCTPQGSFMLSTIVPDDVEKKHLLVCHDLGSDPATSELFIASVSEVTATGVYFEIYSMDGTGVAIIQVEHIWKMPK